MSGCNFRHETAEEVVDERILGVDRVGQPTPDLNPQGTGCCFACSSAAIIRYFAAQVGIPSPTLEEVYAVWAGDRVKCPTGGSSPAMEEFWSAWHYDVPGWREVLEREQDPPLELPERWNAAFPFGPKLYRPSVLYKRVRARIDAGWAIHVEMQCAPQRPRTGERKPSFGSDHLLVIDGYRRTYRVTTLCTGEGGGSFQSGGWTEYLHIVDSRRTTPEPYWVKVDDWVEDHGGFNMWFVRPTRGPRRSAFPPRQECPNGHRAREEFALAR